MFKLASEKLRPLPMNNDTINDDIIIEETQMKPGAYGYYNV